MRRWFDQPRSYSTHFTSRGSNQARTTRPDLPDTENVPLDDFARHVSEVLTRADTLFRSAPLDAPVAASAAQLADAAEMLRRNVAPQMAGSAVSGYTAFAQGRASRLARLADSDMQLDHLLQQAAISESTAATASRLTVSAADGYAGKLLQTDAATTGQRPLIAALHSQVARQREIVRRHQEQAGELAAQVRLLSYE